MFRMSKVAALTATAALVAVGGLAAAPLELGSPSPSGLEAPPGFDPGLWNALPELDQRAILGEPYPQLVAPEEARSTGASSEPASASSRIPQAAPAGIDQGLWELLPDEDRRAILGEPYPTLYATGEPSQIDEGGRTLAPPPGREDPSCFPVGPIPAAC